MAVPKRKWSKARTSRRKSQWKLSAPNLVSCDSCNTLKLQHRVCKKCGTYKGKSVIEIKEEKQA